MLYCYTVAELLGNFSNNIGAQINWIKTVFQNFIILLLKIKSPYFIPLKSFNLFNSKSQDINCSPWLYQWGCICSITLSASLIRLFNLVFTCLKCLFPFWKQNFMKRNLFHRSSSYYINFFVVLCVVKCLYEIQSRYARK